MFPVPLCSYFFGIVDAPLQASILDFAKCCTHPPPSVLLRFKSIFRCLHNNTVYNPVNTFFDLMKLINSNSCTWLTLYVNRSASIGIILLHSRWQLANY